jgi:hypothetical protein
VTTTVKPRVTIGDTTYEFPEGTTVEQAQSVLDEAKVRFLLKCAKEAEAERDSAIARAEKAEAALDNWRQQAGTDYRGLVDKLLAVNDRAISDRDAYRAMVCDLLASAHPHPTEHPTMTRQWNRARELLKNGPGRPTEASE